MLDIGVLWLTILIMTFIGMELEVSHLRNVMRSHSQLAATLLAQTLMLPVIADYAAFASVYFVLEVPLLLAAVAVYRHWSNRYQFTLAAAPKPE